MVTITDTMDYSRGGFKILFLLRTPGQRQFAQDSYPDIETPVIEVNEHQLLGSYHFYDEETDTHVEFYRVFQM